MSAVASILRSMMRTRGDGGGGGGNSSAAAPFDIDCVWTFCSPRRLATTRAFAPTAGQVGVPCPAVADLRYSMRAVAQHMPYVRNFVVVLADDDALPAWLDAQSPRLRVVRHSEIVPPGGLPTFNSNVVESYIHRIPGLAEHIVYLNDDTYVGRATHWRRLFTRGGKPIARLCRGPPDHPLGLETDNMFVRMMQHAILAHGMHNTRYQHQVQPTTRSLLRAHEARFVRELQASLGHRHRQPDDFNLMRFTTCFASSEGAMPAQRTGEQTDFFTEADDCKRVLRLPTSGKRGKPPRFFCINNTRPRHGHVYQVLSRMFPEPCELERHG